MQSDFFGVDLIEHREERLLACGAVAHTLKCGVVARGRLANFPWRVTERRQADNPSMEWIALVV
jgi:hypothetical protein